jgi:hypothetical protein
MLAQVLQIYWSKEHLVKIQLISTLSKVIYFKGTSFQRSEKPLSSLHKIERNRLKKNYPFFIDFYGSYPAKNVTTKMYKNRTPMAAKMQNARKIGML